MSAQWRAADARHLSIGGVDRFGPALILILATIVVQFSVSESGVGQVVAIALGAGTLIFVLTTSEAKPWLVAAVRVGGLAAIGLAIAAVLTGESDRTSWIVPLLGGTMAFVAPIAIAHRLLRHAVVSVPTVLGAICLYLLMGLFFAYLFAIVGGIAPPFFTQGADQPLSSYVYFSFITLTTVGFGDFTAATNVARMLVALEALTGQIYLVTVIALLVANLGRGPRAGIKDLEDLEDLEG